MRKSKDLFEIINEFSSKHILVIGDLILDVYLTGTTTRLSPEAPVPVVDVERKQVVLGGAANVVCNLKKLGASVEFCTVIGDDADGSTALKLLEEMQVSNKFIINARNRRTLVKSRISSAGHVITRFDEGTKSPVDETITDDIAEHIKKSVGNYDVIIISDYDKGVVTEKLLQSLKPLIIDNQTFVAVDSKRIDFFQDFHPHFVKPNYEESINLLGLEKQSANRSEQLSRYGNILHNITGSELVAVTLDSEGAIIFKNGELQTSKRAPKIQSPHVSGAGDTFMASFVLSYSACQNISQSTDLAIGACAVAIAKEGTSTCSAHELTSYFSAAEKAISTTTALQAYCDRYRREGRTIVFTNGCFDILHSGHVTYLEAAKKLGDILIVGVNTDASIKRLKGMHRPINPLSDRVKVLSALSSIDHVIAFGTESDDTPIPVIKEIRPDIFVKGGDYTKDKLPEATTVEKFGGKIIFIPLVPDHSTTKIIHQINGEHPPIKKVINS
jgi:D-beta-D-heptose 7-phosphate kinase / D-beta-D-heptose 1-phosphate adenosyltransferase